MGSGVLNTKPYCPGGKKDEPHCENSNIKAWITPLINHYTNVERTLCDVEPVLQFYFSLKPKMDNYTYNDGHTDFLLCLHGTVPITYRSNPYNIPVAFWIPIAYPQQPPIPYVKPTTNMLIREGKHVDKSGLCYHPYRSSWKEDPNKHNLLELVIILQRVFGEEPPVFTKPMSKSPLLPKQPSGVLGGLGSSIHAAQRSPQLSMPTPPLPPPPPIPASSTSSELFTASSMPDTSAARWTGDGTAFYNIHQGMAGLALNPYPPTSSQTPPPVPTTTTSSSMVGAKSMSMPTIGPTASPAGLTNTTAQHRMSDRSIQDALFRKVADRMQAFHIAISAEMDRLLVVNRQLNDGEIKIERERTEVTDAIQQIQINLEIMQQRIKDMDAITTTVNQMPDVPVDESLCGTTVVWNQLFDLVAEDNAIVDTIYYLSRALNSERITLATFLKCTRALAREQFMKRALIKKIQTASASSVK